MPKLHNLTRFSAVDLLSLTKEGRRRLVVCVAARFSLPRPGDRAGIPALADEQRPPPLADVYLGEHVYLNTQAAIKVLQMRLSDEDKRSFLEEARTIASAMGTSARFVAFPGVPHMPIIDARPEQWRREVEKFLAQVL